MKILAEFSPGRYSPGRSVLHRSDPRTKVILTLLLVITVLLVKSYPAFLLLLSFIWIMTFWAGKSLPHLLLGLRPIFWLALCAIFFHLLTVKGTPLASTGFLRYISSEGLNFSARMILRLVLMVSCASLLTYTTTPLTLMDGLERLLKPLRHIGVPVQQFTMILTLALRFIPVIVDEAERIANAQMSRSATLQSRGVRQRVKSFLPLLMPLFVGLFRRGDALATAMESRCYRGDVVRSRMRPLHFSAADLISCAITSIFLAVLFFVEYKAL